MQAEEDARASTLVVVPHSPSHQPKVRGVPHVSRMIGTAGRRLGLLD